MLFSSVAGDGDVVVPRDYLIESEVALLKFLCHDIGYGQGPRASASTSAPIQMLVSCWYCLAI